MKYETICIVDEWGVIEPTFKVHNTYTSGHLKYLHILKGKKVKIILEVLDENM